MRTIAFLFACLLIAASAAQAKDVSLLGNDAITVVETGSTAMDTDGEKNSQAATEGSGLTEAERACHQEMIDMHERRVKLTTSSTAELILMFLDEARAECKTDEDLDDLYSIAHMKSLTARHLVGLHNLALRDAEHYLTSAAYCADNLLWTQDMQRVVTLGYSAKKYSQLAAACLGWDSVFEGETMPTTDELQWGLAGAAAGSEWFLRRRLVEPLAALSGGNGSLPHARRYKSEE